MDIRKRKQEDRANYIQMRWLENVACMRKMKSAYKITVRKSQGKIPFGKQRHRCNNIIN
jgi:hypothetical protein